MGYAEEGVARPCKRCPSSQLDSVQNSTPFRFSHSLATPVPSRLQRIRGKLDGLGRVLVERKKGRESFAWIQGRKKAREQERMSKRIFERERSRFTPASDASGVRLAQ